MVNNADPVEGEFEDSLVYVPGIFSCVKDSAVGVMQRLQQQELEKVSSALEPTIAPETAFFCGRPPKTLLEHRLKSTTLYMQCRLRNLTICMLAPFLSLFAAGLPVAQNQGT